MIITKDSIIIDILKNIIGSINILEKFNMGCYSCMNVQTETLEKGALMHGIDITMILEELNNLNKK